MSLMTFTTYAQSTLLGDVNGDGKVTVADAMMVVNIIVKGYAPFFVEPNSVSMPVGGTATLEILGGYNQYEVTSANIIFVEATLEGSTITLSAISSGETKVFVKDVKTQRILEIPVIVEKNSSTSYLTCPDDHHPHMIDLGLPSGTLWSCCNVDTDHPENQTPTNYGGYYAWGETEAKSTYNLSTYVHCDGSSNTCHDLGCNIAGTEYDVAHMKWRGVWQMPAQYQIDELLSNCNYEWTTFNGVNGGKFTGSNGGSIFVPASGCCFDSHSYNVGSCVYLLSSTQSPTRSNYALYLHFSSNQACTTHYYRDVGFSVRPVVSGSTVADLQLLSTSLSIMEGKVESLGIFSGSGSYDVQTSDETVATAIIQYNAVSVTAVSAGTATITLTDHVSGQTVNIEVTVNAFVPSFLICPDGNHPHLIDLGLPSDTKWACCNVGAQTPTDYGGYYAWGETEEKDYYYWSTYIHCDGSEGTCHDLGNDIAGTEYDVAHVKWGGIWLMPTCSQQEELLNNCSYEWTIENGVYGGRFTGSNGASIFLPASENRWCNLPSNVGSIGYYWSSTQYPSYSVGADYLYFNSDDVGCSSGFDHYYGFPVRPVSR